MADKMKALGYEMQRVIDLGLIDNWLRGLSQIAPRAVSADITGQSDDFNTHLFAYDSTDSIHADHIQNLAGCRQLLASCSKNNVFVEIKFTKDKCLSIKFQPEHQFNKSVIFGASYHNVLPTLFKRSTPALEATH